MEALKTKKNSTMEYAKDVNSMLFNRTHGAGKNDWGFAESVKKDMTKAKRNVLEQVMNASKTQAIIDEIKKAEVDYLNEKKSLLEKVDDLSAEEKTKLKTHLEALKKKLKDNINLQKKLLPVVVMHGLAIDGKRKVAESASNYTLSCWATLDIDNVDDPQKLWEEKIKPHAEALRIVWAYISPSGHGLKIIFMRPQNLTVRLAQKWFATRIGIDGYDAKTYDLARCQYITLASSNLLYCPDKLFDDGLTNEGYLVELDLETVFEELEEGANNVEQITGPVQPLPVGTNAIAQLEKSAIDKIAEQGYHGIKWEVIIAKYWEINNDGMAPILGDRNTKIYELALDLRHIAGFNVEVLTRIIPNYDDFPEDEKVQTIRNAVSARSYQMPARMKAVLDALKPEYAHTTDIESAIEEIEERQDTYAFTKLKEGFGGKLERLPMGVRDSLDGIPEPLYMVAIIGVGPMIGALATGIRLSIHLHYSALNLSAYIVGEAASGKSHIDALYRTWMNELLLQDAIQFEMLEQWKALPKKEREKTPRPVSAIRIQPLRTSMADVLEHLKNSQGKHLFSYTAEADQLTQTRTSGAFANVSVLIRMSYDGAEFKSSFNGESAVNANVDQVLWNMVLCTTPDGLHRAVTNVTNGEQTRLPIAETPDNTFAPLVLTPPRKEQSNKNIGRVAHLLTLMQGNVDLPMLEKRCGEWLESVRLTSSKNDDKVYARQRMRVAVNAMRYTCCLMLCAYAEWLFKNLDDRKPSKEAPKWAKGCKSAEQYLTLYPDAPSHDMKRFQTEEYMNAFEVLADYMIETTLHFFRARIEKAYANPSYTGSKRKIAGSNDTIFDSLPRIFVLEQAREAKRRECDNADINIDNATKQMLKNWKKQSLIKALGGGKYEKMC